MKFTLQLAGAALAIAIIALAGFIADANIRIAREETGTPSAGAPGRFIMVGEHTLHAATVGDITADASGAPLVLLHGYGVQGHAAWLPWATRLTATRSLIMPDMLGFGHSDRTAQPGPHYTVKNQAAALAAILDDLDIAHVDIVGNALGGAIAAQFALAYPARVRRVVFMDAAIYSRPHIAGTGMRLIDRALLWQFRTGGPRSDLAQSCGTQGNCRPLRLARVRGTTDALIAMTHTPDESDLAQRIPEITAPSLVIWGADDHALPVADGDRLARDLKTTISIVANAGDKPYVSQPEKVAQRVMDFLQTPAAP
jgi:pimeloyl-ACP methyl ester carboxylesterase